MKNKGLHVQKRQKVRTLLEKNQHIFKDNTRKMWSAFNKIQNQIRPGQIYGGAVDGKKLGRTVELFRIIENICGVIE